MICSQPLSAAVGITVVGCQLLTQVLTPGYYCCDYEHLPEVLEQAFFKDMKHYLVGRAWGKQVDAYALEVNRVPSEWKSAALWLIACARKHRADTGG
jgi:hypothetical protein